ncbi:MULTISPECIES: hypothetical protein [Nitrobacteraceae]|uniref:hypothetical protein n=1 Tax=Nitrobacteraceae TaxID=41294 RepID=UPI0009E9EDD6|nr:MULTISPECIES: hypothetical protein [Nitrobacteraceae]MBN9149692.1 hypothetical protein [Nitrobacter sp.]
MDKKIAGLIGAVATLGACNVAEAAPPVVNPAPTDVLQANSYADLLQPIPNALTTLQAIDAASSPSADGQIELAQFYYHHHHHHHHHHHRWHRAPRIVVVPPRWHHHHHHHHFYHHHHHHHFYRDDD